MTRPRKAGTLIAALALAAGFLCGCTIIRTEPSEIHELDENRYDHGTHYSRVLDDMGPPTRMSQLGTGMVWLYENMALTENQIGIGFRDGPLSLFKLNFASGEGSYEGSVLIFDRDGLLVTAQATRDSIDLGQGTGFQFVFDVSSLVDTTDLQTTPAQFSWGDRLLTDLPAGLNARQNLASGENGVRLSTTPASAGQHTLATP